MTEPGLAPCVCVIDLTKLHVNSCPVRPDLLYDVRSYKEDWVDEAGYGGQKLTIFLSFSQRVSMLPTFQPEGLYASNNT